MHNREGLNIRMLWEALTDWHLWPLYAIALVFGGIWTLYLSFRLSSLWRSNSFFTIVPALPPQAYLTLSLRHLGFTTTQTNLLTIPASVIGMMTLLSIAFISEVVNSRIAVALIAQSWVMILLIALYTFDANTSSWVYFAVVSLIAGSPAVHPIQTAWVSRNACSVRTRFVYYYLSIDIYWKKGLNWSFVQDGFYKRIQHDCSGLCNRSGE